MKIKIVKEISSIKELFEELKLEENSIYVVRVQVHANNPEHESFLFTGFKNGNYCYIYNNTIEGPRHLSEYFSIKIIKKLYTKK